MKVGFDSETKKHISRRVQIFVKLKLKREQSLGKNLELDKH